MIWPTSAVGGYQMMDSRDWWIENRRIFRYDEYGYDDIAAARQRFDES